MIMPQDQDAKKRIKKLSQRPTFEEAIKHYPLLLEDIRFHDIDHDLPRRVRDMLAPIFDKLLIRKTEFNWLMLSTAEIISNLLKHPVKKPSVVNVRFYAANKGAVMLDISDDASPFMDFIQRRADSLAIIEQKRLTDSGRGLALISKAHPDHDYRTADMNEDGLNHFTIWFPQRADVQHIFEPEGLANQGSVPAIVKGRFLSNIHKDKSAKPTLMLVDDDKTVRMVLERTLQDDYSIHLFDCGDTALAAFDEVDPDMVISDLNMPGMDGITLRKELSKRPKGNVTPFIFLSGDAQAATKQYITTLGIDDYLVKPVRKDRLISVIERLLSRSKQVKNDIQGRVDTNITEILKPALPPYMAGWKTAVCTSSASSGGGDFLLYETGDFGAAMVLSDVMGHGLEAKFFSYAFAGYFRSLFSHFYHKELPHKMLTFFSKAIKKDPVLEHVAISCLALNIKPEGTLSIAAAAHPKPYLLRANSRQIEQIDVAGPLPGLAGNASYMAKNLILDVGDRLLLFTDGLVEVKADFEATLENEHMFSQLLLETSCMPIDQASQRLWHYYTHTIKGFANFDDSTLVLLEYAPHTHQIDDQSKGDT